MLDKSQVEKLAELARIKISEEEKEEIVKDLGKILDYVKQVEEVGGLSEEELPELQNVFREDENPHQSGEFSGDLLESAPNRKGDYFAVKKIL